MEQNEVSPLPDNVAQAMSQVNPILDEDLSKVSTDMPLLPEGNYPLNIKDIEVGPNKAGSGQVLKITFETTMDYTSIRGEPIGKGFPIFHNIGLSETEKYTADAIRRNLARFVEAAEGKATRLQPVERFRGKVVECKLKIDSDEEYGTRNVVKRFIKQ